MTNVIRASAFFRHFTFVIRHFETPGICNETHCDQSDGVGGSGVGGDFLRGRVTMKDSGPVLANLLLDGIGQNP